MADYIPIDSSEYDPEAPLTSSLVSRIVNNPVAIAEGASGAPRIQTGAIANSAVTSNKIANNSVTTTKLQSSERMTNANVRSMTASSSVGAVGTYAFLRLNSTQSPGGTRAGSSLWYADSDNGSSQQTPSGTWRCMGEITTQGTSTLWLRIS